MSQMLVYVDERLKEKAKAKAAKDKNVRTLSRYIEILMENDLKKK